MSDTPNEPPVDGDDDLAPVVPPEASQEPDVSPVIHGQLDRDHAFVPEPGE